MAISYNKKTRIFTIESENSTYAFMVEDKNLVSHLYYGEKIQNKSDLSYLLNATNVGRASLYDDFSYEEFEGGAARVCPHARYHEYSTFGIGDFRTPCLSGNFDDGSQAIDLRYFKHQIIDGKSELKDLPSSYANEGQKAQTLILTLKDSVRDLYVELYYSVIDGCDAIMRHSKIVNRTGGDFFLNSALSANLDIYGKNYDVITFYGRNTNERYVERTPVRHGRISGQSSMGITSNYGGNSIILCDSTATETCGNCYGATLVYSGNYIVSAELDQVNRVRMTIGINPDGFRWKLLNGEEFTTPEVIFSYSSSGLGQLSRNFHDIIRYNICRGKFRDSRRPVLINNWEATLFDFNEEKLVRFASEAKKFGAEMLVVDDGWFGHNRDWDNAALGDWFENRRKLPDGVSGLCEKINSLDMKLGLWFEPEMISEDSDLFRAHPDYCVRVPNRAPMRSRWQLVLDMSRKEVVDCIYEQMEKVLSSCPISYVKWDMNRNITDAYSLSLESERQGEFYHRYMLGVYDLMSRITNKFPDILLENCAGGGGRYDAGMLCYSPQIWCSDNTDPYHRMKIQYGTSLIYPVSTMGAHVAYSPNINSYNPASAFVRGVAAMAGTFGFELDPDEEDDKSKKDILFMANLYKKHYFTINHGDYYRLLSPYEQSTDTTRISAWQFVSKDKSQALFCSMQLDNSNSFDDYYVKLQGLDANKSYSLNMIYEYINPKKKPFVSEIMQKEMGVFSGDVLMKAGLHLNLFRGENMSCIVEIHQI